MDQACSSYVFSVVVWGDNTPLSFRLSDEGSGWRCYPSVLKSNGDVSEVTPPALIDTRSSSCVSGNWVLDDGSCVEDEPPPFNCDSAASDFNSLSAEDRTRVFAGTHTRIDGCLPIGPEGACRVTGRITMRAGSGSEMYSWAVLTMSSGSAGVCTPGEHQPEDPGDSAPEVPEDSPPCKDGIPGEINGEPVCVPTKGNPDVTTSTTDTETQTHTDTNNSTQTVTIETTTTCTGDTCTTTRVTTVEGNASGSGHTEGTSIEGTTTSRAEFCKNNPQSVQCRPGAGGDGPGGEGDEESEDSNAGGSLPGVPTLYESKYPDGLSGVWEGRGADLLATPLGGLARRLMPTFNTGSEPSWKVDLNFGGNWDFGTYDLAPSSSVWAALRAIVLVLAGIFSLRLVFGGA